MDRRIKIVYIITIVSLILLMIIQGYWLMNQYEYALKRYKDELFIKTWKTWEKDFQLRRTLRQMRNKKDPCISNIYSRYVMNLDDKKVYSHWNVHITIKRKKSGYFKSYTFKQVEVSNKENINTAENMLIVNESCPFTISRFNFLLKENGLHCKAIFIEKMQRRIWTPLSSYRTSLGETEFRIVAPIDILQKKQVSIVYNIGITEVMGKMIPVLLFSFIFIVLLASCLIYQILTMRKQQRIDELRRNFIQTMVHELKRPIATVKMAISFMKNGKMLQDKQLRDELLLSAQQEVDNLSSYFSKLRDLTYGDLEEVPLNLVSFDLKEVVNNSLLKINLPAGRNIHLSKDVPAEAMPMRADKMHLGNIISNLLENAVKYSEGDSEIAIACSEAGKNYLIRISDTGYGMSEEDCRHAFDKFYRSERLRGKNIPGMGLGLNYVYLLVKAHHGTITLKSTLGMGTTFIISIPKEQ